MMSSNTTSPGEIQKSGREISGDSAGKRRAQKMFKGVNLYFINL